MTRHSKNNKALGHFTAAEKGMLKNQYGKLTQRLGKDSLRKINSCILCLQDARQPHICKEGHLYCRECVFENIIAQRKQIAKEEKEVSVHNASVETEADKRIRLEQEKKLQDFVAQETTVKTLVERNPDDWVADSFWLPSMQKTAQIEPLKQTKITPQCYGGKEPHPISLKKLTAVIFAGEEGPPICPVCMKGFTLSSKVLVLKPCGHAVCQDCSKKFNQKKTCAVCSEKYKSVQQIALEGTGFAAGGVTEAVKQTPGFL